MKSRKSKTTSKPKRAASKATSRSSAPKSKSKPSTSKPKSAPAQAKRSAPKAPAQAKRQTKKPPQKATLRVSNVGKVYRGRTKYIDPDTKPERNYVVVKDNGKEVSVAKLKSIKKFDENGRNADKALMEINSERYGLERRTGVDFQRFDTNRMSKKPLKLEDKDAFPEGKERFKLGSHDLSRVLRHTKAKK